MAKLNLVAATRWAGSAGGFATFPVLVGLCVSDEAGHGLAGLPRDAFEVRYLDDPDNGAVEAAVTFFRELDGGAGKYELVFTAGPEGQHFRQDELFVYLSVASGGDTGHAVTAAHYHVFGP
jgi:hypothetical protein